HKSASHVGFRANRTLSRHGHRVAFDPDLTLRTAHAITSADALPAHQRDAIAKTCRSKRAYSFLICTRTLSNSALAARAARSASRAATSAPATKTAVTSRYPEVLSN